MADIIATENKINSQQEVINDATSDADEPETNNSEPDVDDEDIEKTSQNNDMQEEDKSSFFSFLDGPQKAISSGVETFARNIDEFFSNDNVFYESSGTYLRLTADMILEEDGQQGYQGDIKLKLRLPHTRQKLKLTFESDAGVRADELSGEPENTPIDVVEEKDYFAGIQATLGRKDEWQFKPSIGLRLGSNVEPYIRFRAQREYHLDDWSIRWNETPYWFDSFGWGFDSYLEFNNKLSNTDLFRAATFARWTRETEKFELSQTFSMFHTLSPRRAVSYYIGVYGESEPTVYATHYLVGLSYRQNIHKDYLFLELLPQIRYNKDNEFHAEHSIIFRLEMVFKK